MKILLSAALILFYLNSSALKTEVINLNHKCYSLIEYNDIYISQGSKNVYILDKDFKTLDSLIKVSSGRIINNVFIKNNKIYTVTDFYLVSHEIDADYSFKNEEYHIYQNEILLSYANDEFIYIMTNYDGLLVFDFNYPKNYKKVKSLKNLNFSSLNVITVDNSYLYLIKQTGDFNSRGFYKINKDLTDYTYYKLENLFNSEDHSEIALGLKLIDNSLFFALDLFFFNPESNPGGLGQIELKNNSFSRIKLPNSKVFGGLGLVLHIFKLADGRVLSILMNGEIYEDLDFSKLHGNIKDYNLGEGGGLICNYLQENKTSIATGSNKVLLIESESSKIVNIKSILNYSIFPNPTETGFTLNIDNFDLTKACTLQVYDMNGKEILSNNIIESQSFISLPSHLQNGTYLVKVKTKDSVQTTKLILKK